MTTGIPMAAVTGPLASQKMMPRIVGSIPAKNLIFNRAVMMPGDIIERASDTWIGRGIRLALHSHYNHDALWIVETTDGHGCYIGDAQLPRAQMTPVSEYEDDLAAGRCQCRVIRPVGATAAQGQAASDWWEQKVCGQPYDLQAYWRIISELGLPLRLAAKIVWDKLYPGKSFPEPAEWAWYCTESVAAAWTLGAGFQPDPWRGKKLPTPGTTEKRTREGIFRVVRDALIPA